MTRIALYSLGGLLTALLILNGTWIAMIALVAAIDEDQ